MLLRSLVVVGLVGLLNLAANGAAAEDAKLAPRIAAIDGVSFVDPTTQNPLAPIGGAPTLNLSASDSGAPRFAQFNSAPQHGEDASQNYEVALTAARGTYGLPMDVSIAHHTSLGFTPDGDLARQGGGSEVRLGRGLSRLHRKSRSSWDHPAFYVFAASDNEALTWAPTSSGPGGRSAGFALQDQIRIGDSQAGLTYEAGPFQASLAYVQRKVSARTGATTV